MGGGSIDRRGGQLQPSVLTTKLGGRPGRASPGLGSSMGTAFRALVAELPVPTVAGGGCGLALAQRGSRG